VTMRAGELKAVGLVGPIELDTSGTDVELDRLERATGTIRLKAMGGSATIRGLRTEARLDVRGAKVDVALDRAVAVGIYNEGGEDTEVTVPPGGFQLDAAAIGGDIVVPDGGPAVTGGEESDHYAVGPVHGGGPTITIRSTGGDIRVRNR
jgi:hypothetical protein